MACPIDEKCHPALEVIAHCSSKVYDSTISLVPAATKVVDEPRDKITCFNETR